MRPSPTMPSVCPGAADRAAGRAPAGPRPARTSARLRGSRRAAASISANASSAVASVSTSGVFETAIPRARRRRDVDVVEADRAICDDAQLRRTGEPAVVDPVEEKRHDRIDVGQVITRETNPLFRRRWHFDNRVGKLRAHLRFEIDRQTRGGHDAHGPNIDMTRVLSWISCLPFLLVLVVMASRRDGRARRAARPRAFRSRPPSRSPMPAWKPPSRRSSPPSKGGADRVHERSGARRAVGSTARKPRPGRVHVRRRPEPETTPP